MMFPFVGLVLDVLLPLIAIGIAIRALRAARGAPPAAPIEERIAALEGEVRGLLHRVWMLERGDGVRDAPAGVERAPEVVAPDPSRAESFAPPSAEPVPPARAARLDDAPADVAGGPDARLGPELSPAPGTAPAAGAHADSDLPWTLPKGASAAAPASAAPRSAAEAPPPTTAPRADIDLEQRIGARWATWVGIVAILFAVSFFLKWSFDSDLIGPRARVALGGAAGLALLCAGLALSRRRDVPYLSEGLAGLGLGVLYLSLWAGHGLYGLLGAPVAFACMLVVTVLGAVVAVVSSRQITAALAVLGGLLTPILLTVQRPDERNLLVYLLVLDFLVLAVARFRSWPALNRLAWAGSALLFLPVFLRQPEAPHPLTRLVLLSGLFLLFVAVPLLRERAEYRRIGEVDLLLVVGNAAGYFWVVYVTLDAWHPIATGPYALALAVVYRAAAADYAARVTDDLATVRLHEGIAWTFLTLAVPLAFDARWVTLAWAVEGAMLLWLAARMTTPVAAWGGFLASALAASRAAFLDRAWYPDFPPVWNSTYLIHLFAVAALIGGGAFAGKIRSTRLPAETASAMQNTLWVMAVVVLAVLCWREPPGLWPAVLLTGLVLVLGALARVSMAPAFVVASALVAAILLARVLVVDDALARAAAASLLNRPLFSRAAACVAIALAGAWLSRSDASPRAESYGRVLSGAGAVALLLVLSAGWMRYQEVGVAAAASAGQREAIRWTMQVGLSVLWTLYAACALAYGFLRAAPAVRYGGLALLGVTVLKVFLVDLSAVRTAYRMLSFLILGVVLLLVSLAYQKARRPGAPAAAEPPGR